MTRSRSSRAIALIVAGTLCAAQAGAQTAAAPAAPTFAVSVIKPSGPASGSGLSIKFLPGGRLIARNATLRVLTKIAYNLNDDQLAGGPDWTAFKRFDIDAKPDTPSAADAPQQDRQLYNRLLMQSLLKDRFHLQLSTSTREMSVYTLIVGKGGPKLTRSAATDEVVHFSGGTGAVIATNATMDNLANALQDKVGGHPVQNMTGLAGRYDFRLEWFPDPPLSPPTGNAPVDVVDLGPNLMTAVQQQLGLKLEARKIAAPYQVIESVQIPTDN